MQKSATYLMYFPRLYITCLTLLSKLSEREREVEHTVTIYKSFHFLNKEYRKKITTICTWLKNKIYMDTIIITFLNRCQPRVFTPTKSLFFVIIFFLFTQNPVGNLIFRMNSFTKLCCSVNIHGSEFLLIFLLLLWNWMTYFIAWFPSWMSLQILTSIYFSLLPSNIFHNVPVTFFPICTVSNIWAIHRCS